MDAILALARGGETGIVGSTLYCTNYPCHYCAKHIIAAGINRVVYLEPYEKSLARKLHFGVLARKKSRQNKLLRRRGVALSGE